MSLATVTAEAETRTFVKLSEVHVDWNEYFPGREKPIESSFFGCVGSDELLYRRFASWDWGYTEEMPHPGMLTGVQLVDMIDEILSNPERYSSVRVVSTSCECEGDDVIFNDRVRTLPKDMAVQPYIFEAVRRYNQQDLAKLFD